MGGNPYPPLWTKFLARKGLPIWGVPAPPLYGQNPQSSITSKLLVISYKCESTIHYCVFWSLWNNQSAADGSCYHPATMPAGQSPNKFWPINDRIKKISYKLGPGRPLAGGPRMDRRVVTSSGVVNPLIQKRDVTHAGRQMTF